ncbi:MAG: hypothetical protein JW934_02865 [Anaerolineae bacterium]|nr:hypothetical protein [Anaerolineae bacterium]
MTNDSREREIQTAAADLSNSLIHKDHYASTHLARLILAGEDSAYLSLAQAMAECLQRWPKGVMQAADVLTVLRAAARDVTGETTR